MNKLEVNQVGGFPLTTRILDELQKAYTIFNALGAIVGEITIISGCTVTGSNVSDGVVFINGEVLEFRGGLAQTKVRIVEEVENLTFQNGNANPVIKTRYATFGSGVGAVDWANFKRGFQTKDLVESLALKAEASIVTAISDAVALMYTKLNTIETGAQKQVRSDWNATTGVKAIDNKPDFSSPFLHKGVYPVGDVTSTDNIRTITFPDVGTNNYLVFAFPKVADSDWNRSNDTFLSWGNPTNTSFEVYLREISSNVQNINVGYVLIAL
ncbi:hypothetical protein [Flavobacterium laiguense]|uniref:Uncharacterized protein n=1 Tax=Flavobacterium laiguense TaxID=2169409 RepID=A0A2U1JJY5_9FLAO|nr:hypothetical protein [Flavobacterium laiguense]PWA05476.1 hypothetical protein DB891_17045 [Flavobacterium laiguense]